MATVLYDCNIAVPLPNNNPNCEKQKQKKNDGGSALKESDRVVPDFSPRSIEGGGRGLGSENGVDIGGSCLVLKKISPIAKKEAEAETGTKTGKEKRKYPKFQETGAIEVAAKLLDDLFSAADNAKEVDLTGLDLDPEMFHDLGEALMREKKHAEASEIFKQGITEYGTKHKAFFEAKFNLANTLFVDEQVFVLFDVEKTKDELEGKKKKKKKKERKNQAGRSKCRYQNTYIEESEHPSFKGRQQHT